MQLKEVEINAVGKVACGLCWNTLLYGMYEENLPCIEGAFIRLNYVSTTKHTYIQSCTIMVVVTKLLKKSCFYTFVPHVSVYCAGKYFILLRLMNL